MSEPESLQERTARIGASAIEKERARRAREEAAAAAREQAQMELAPQEEDGTE